MYRDFLNDNNTFIIETSTISRISIIFAIIYADRGQASRRPSCLRAAYVGRVVASAWDIEWLQESDPVSVLAALLRVQFLLQRGRSLAYDRNRRCSRFGAEGQGYTVVYTDGATVR